MSPEVAQSSSTETSNSSYEATQEAAKLLAATFHENWRQTRLNDEGGYEPRVKTTKDQKWIEAHGSDQVDIANTEYADLPEDWRAENKEAAEVVVGVIDGANGNIDLNNPEVRNQVGERVHQAWLDRNEWVRDPQHGQPELVVPFEQLSQEEQAKDIEQVKIGLEVLSR